MKLMVGIVALVAAVAAFLAAPIVSQNQEHPSSAAHIEFDRPDGVGAPERGVIDNATARLDMKTRAIRVVEGLVSVSGAETIEDAAVRFISSTFGIAASGNGTTRLEVENRQDTLTGRHLTYQMYYLKTDTGVSFPISGSTLVVHVNDKKQVTYASNETVPISNPVLIRNASAISAMDASKAALAYLAREEGNASVTSTKQVVMVSKGTPVLVWRVSVLTKRPSASMELLLDASTGSVISSQNLAQYKANIN